jgi:hypothetical protein
VNRFGIIGYEHLILPIAYLFVHTPAIRPDCQTGCRGRLKHKNTGVSFSSEETHAVLDSKRMNPKLSEAIVAKYSVLGLSESSDILFRNFINFMYNSKED